nr:sugar ABC transporter permease [uncultured Eisenbergiella sp.]
MNSPIKNKRPVSTLERKERRYFYLFIAPWLVGFFLLTIGPMIYSFYCALCDWDGMSAPVFTGLDNYTRTISSNQDFRRALVNTFVYAVFSVPTSMLFALFLAFLLNKNHAGAGIFQALFYFPSVAAGTAVYMVWIWLFNGETGVFNYLLSLVGIEGPKWLSSTEWAMPSLILMNLTFCGQAMLIFLAGLKQVPAAYYEAAEIDGASEFAKFMKITLPMISPVVLLNTIMGMISAFQIFNQPFIMTGGGPMKSTYMYGMLIYDTGFYFFRFGEAAAQSWILCFLLVVLTVIVMKLINRKTVYEL